MISVDVSVDPKSARDVLRASGNLSRQTRQALHETVEELTLATHNAAVRGIQRGPASGRVYQKYRPRRTHQASAPGQYPATDRGRLASSIMFVLPTLGKNPVGQVYTNLRYGLFLEMKSPSRGGRPWLLRSYNRATKETLATLLRNLQRKRKRRR